MKPSVHIKDFPVMIRRKRKIGRPSKAEILISEIMSKIYNSKAFRDELEKYACGTMINGHGTFDCESVMQRFLEAK